MYWIMHNYVHLVDCLFQLVQNAQMLKTNWKLISLSSCKAEVLSKINIHNWALIAWGAETTFRSVFLGMNLSSSAPPSRIVLKIQMCTNLTLPQPEPSVLLASSVALVYSQSSRATSCFWTQKMMAYLCLGKQCRHWTRHLLEPLGCES